MQKAAKIKKKAVGSAGSLFVLSRPAGEGGSPDDVQMALPLPGRHGLNETAGADVPAPDGSIDPGPLPFPSECWGAGTWLTLGLTQACLRGHRSGHVTWLRRAPVEN